MTAKRKEGEFDLELSIGAITEELCEYPEDIVRTVCREWARTNTFFPVLKELLDECNKLMELRKSLLSQMREQRVISNKPKNEEWTPATEDEKKKVSDMVAECIRNLSAG